MKTFDDCKNDTTCLNVDSNQQCVLTGDATPAPTLRLWDMTHGYCAECFVGHENNISCVAVDWRNQVAISGAHDSSLRIWDLNTDKCKKTMSCIQVCSRWREALVPLCLAISWDLRIALSGMDNGSILLWNLDDGIIIARGFWRRLTPNLGNDHNPPRRANCVSVDWDSMQVLAGYEDTTLRFWDIGESVNKSEEVQLQTSSIWHGSTGPISQVFVDWQEHRALSAALDGTITTWTWSPETRDTGERRQSVRVVDTPCQFVIAVDWALGIFATGDDVSLKMWELESCSCLSSVSSGINNVRCLTFICPGSSR